MVVNLQFPYEYILPFHFRYLCEYIYYTSLSIDSARTLFVHVPMMDIYTPQETARALERILDLCMEQINELDADLVNKMKEARLEEQK